MKWQIDRWGHIVDENGESVVFRSVANLCSGSDEAVRVAESNTVLAAAAPQLLEALEDIMDSYIGIFGDAYCQLELDENEESIVNARAAIAAAKGEAK